MFVIYRKWTDYLVNWYNCKASSDKNKGTSLQDNLTIFVHYESIMCYNTCHRLTKPVSYRPTIACLSWESVIIVNGFKDYSITVLQ